MPISANEATRKSSVLMPEGVIGGGGYNLVKDPGANLLSYPGAPGHKPMHLYCDGVSPYLDLVMLDQLFVVAAHEECDQVLIKEYGDRPYALVSALYRETRSLFAVPLRSNIPSDTITKYYLPLQDRESTRRGNHHGFDCTKMLPVCKDVISLLVRPSGPLPAQRELIWRIDDLVEKAQAYLFERESRGPSNTYETDIDAIAKWVLPRFAGCAA